MEDARLALASAWVGCRSEHAHRPVAAARNGVGGRRAGGEPAPRRTQQKQEEEQSGGGMTTPNPRAEEDKQSLEESDDEVNIMLMRFVGLHKPFKFTERRGWTHLLTSRKELTEAQRTNKPCGKCYFYLLISKTFTDKKTNARKKGSSAHQKEELMFSNAEEEFFYKNSLLKFSYSVEEESDSCLGGKWSFEDAPMKPLRTVMIIPADRMDAIMDKLKEYLAV
ncbi:BRCA2 and CDKN1A-interacting protein [Sceloporus undulatus]|uniref:BRCA2 and CDKN1A-interacting protein n=1 Tax=Sceloporus undulatus TaxID=8520 RepID=UPI001C4AE94C|nr:BRCA2 and CDKN1A-interacting protein [Sceloporus undulatus]